MLYIVKDCQSSRRPCKKKKKVSDETISSPIREQDKLLLWENGTRSLSDSLGVCLVQSLFGLHRRPTVGIVGPTGLAAQLLKSSPLMSLNIRAPN